MEQWEDPVGPDPSGLCRTWVKSAGGWLHDCLVWPYMVTGIVPAAECQTVETGQKHTVVIHHIITKDTHDEDVMKALEKKDMRQSSLIEAVRARIGG